MKQRFLEFGIGLGLAVLVSVGQALVTFDSEVEPLVFLSGVGVAVIRTVGAVIVSRIGSRVVS